MPTRNVVLTERQEALIEALVRNGRYQNASEVMREGLRLIEDREAEVASKLEGLRAAAKMGTDALDRGDYKEFSDGGSLAEYLNALTDPIFSDPGIA